MSTHTVEALKHFPEGISETFQSILLFKKGSRKQARNGSDFLIVELADKTGSFATTCFADSPGFTHFSDLAEGSVVRISGQTDHYQGRFSPKLIDVQALSEEEAEPHLPNLVETCVEDPTALWEELQAFIEQISIPELKKTTQLVFEEVGENFKVCPAAISMHHAYISGLLEHTIHVTRAGAALLPLYPEVNKDLAIAGMLMHDTGKVIEYEQYKSPRRSRTGLLNGHVVLGYRMVRKAAMQAKLSEDLRERLEHVILSHQGELEWGAAAMAATPEAVFVSMVDNLDARMGVIQYALRHAQEESPITDYLPALKGSVLTTPIRDL